MAVKKKFCNKHSFYYGGVECPFCLKERVEKFIVKTELQDKNREPTENELAELLNKFNGKL